MARSLSLLVQCLIAAALVVASCEGAALLWQRARSERTEEVQTPPRLDKEGDARFIKLNSHLAESYGIEVAAAVKHDWQERVVVQGRVTPNPQATYEVRSPFAGTVYAAGAALPGPGQAVKAGQSLGWVVVRVGPQDRLDLESRLADARGKLQGAEEASRLRGDIAARLEKVQSAVLVQHDLDEARLQLADARSQLETTRSAVNLWKRALEELDAGRGRNGAWNRPLTAPAEVGPGAQLEVTELAAPAGTAVEAGGLVLRVVDVNRPLLRLDFPAEVLRAGPPPDEVEATAGDGEAPVRAALVGPAGQVDGGSQLVGYLYAVKGATAESPGEDREVGRVLRGLWRPGLYVQARLPLPSAAEEAVAVPATALLYHQGRTLVYVRRKEDRYERREVRVLGWDGDRCVVARRGPFDPEWLNLAAGETVVSDQAQVLLATEFHREGDDD